LEQPLARMECFKATTAQAVNGLIDSWHMNTAVAIRIRDMQVQTNTNTTDNAVRELLVEASKMRSAIENENSVLVLNASGNGEVLAELDVARQPAVVNSIVEVDRYLLHEELA
jgi:hypothetical protein